MTRKILNRDPKDGTPKGFKVFDVNEAGTEAVAVTVVSFGTRGKRQPDEEPLEFTVDRPFLFLVRENVTGSVLFMGRVVRPEYEVPEDVDE